MDDRTKFIWIILGIYLVSSQLALATPLGHSEKRARPPLVQIDTSVPADPIPRKEPLSELGNPSSYMVHGEEYFVQSTSENYHEEGIASWYGKKFHGRKTSSGERYDMYKMTAANKTLPIPCYVRVTNLENGREIVVKVNDRGPFHENRIIDLSYSAAKKLGMLNKGTANVRVDAIGPYQYNFHDSDWDDESDSIPVRHLYLQVGAFGQLANAKKFAEQVHELIPMYVKVARDSRSKHSLYHVQIGPLLNAKQATAINKRLREAHFSIGMLVRS